MKTEESNKPQDDSDALNTVLDDRELQERIKELEEALAASGEQQEALEKVYEARLRQVEEIRQMKFAKVYRAASVRMGKGDPFDSVRRTLSPQEHIRIWIGEKIYRSGGMEVHGWCADPEAPCEYLRVRDHKGELVPVSVIRSVRQDVNATLNLPRERKCGFVMRISSDDLNRRPLTLEAESSHGIVSLPLDAEPDRDRRIVIWQERLAKGEAPDDGPLVAYDDLAYAHRPTEEELQSQKKEEFAYQPLISVVVPLYQTPERFLRELLDSILAQTYGNWELCLADGSPSASLKELVRQIAGDDPRVRYQKLERNEGISGNTNAAIRMAKGEWIVFADHDDLLTADALYEVISLLNENSEQKKAASDPEQTAGSSEDVLFEGRRERGGSVPIDLIYSDEDKITKESGYLYDPFFKPDYDPILLESYNYFTHLVAVRKLLIDRAGMPDPVYDGAQDYDFVLRMSEQARSVGHIPKSLYHWRAHELSTAGNSESKGYAYENGRRALEAHLIRCGIKADVRISRYTGRYEVRPFILEPVSLSIILVPEAGTAAHMLPDEKVRRLFDRVREQISDSAAGKSEASVRADRVSGFCKAGSAAAAAEDGSMGFAVAEVLPADARTVSVPEALNLAAGQAKGTHLLFLSDRIAEAEEGFAELLAGMLSHPDTAASGGRIAGTSGRIRSCGWLIGTRESAVPAFADLSTEVFSYGGYANLPHSVSALSAECMMIRREEFTEFGGFDETFRSALYDADLGLRLKEQGRRSVIVPFAEVLLETKETAPEAQKVPVEDRTYFEKKWQQVIEKGDPYLNPNLSVHNCDFALKGAYAETD